MKQTYNSPRWTNEICDCSMPMTFDTYSKCSYHCFYCFSFYQKSHIMKGYDSLHSGTPEIRSVNPARVIKLFDSALAGEVFRFD